MKVEIDKSDNLVEIGECTYGEIVKHHSENEALMVTDKCKINDAWKFVLLVNLDSGIAVWLRSDGKVIKLKQTEPLKLIEA